MREFVTAVAESEGKAAGEDTTLIEFSVDGKMCNAYRPTSGQIAVYMATAGRHATREDNIAGVVDFFAGVLDRGSRDYLIRRLMDREDPFEVEQVEEIISYLIEEWSGRPTEQASDSHKSPPSTGTSSTRTTEQGSTSSTSLSTAS